MVLAGSQGMNGDLRDAHAELNAANAAVEADTPNGQHFCTIFDLASLP